MRSVVIATLAGAGVLFGLHGASTAQDAGEGDAPPLRAVKVSETVYDADFPTRSFFGRVVARSTVDVAFQVGGEIQTFDVQEGDRVGKGATLAQLDLEPFQLALRSAELQLEQGEREFDRLQTLGRNVAAQANIEDAETARDLAQVAQRDAERDLERATLVAPFDALIATRYVEAFTTVAAGSRVIRLHDMSELRVEIEVPELLFRRATGPENFNIYATMVGDDKKYNLVPREFNAETSDVGQSYVITLAFTDEVDDRVLPGATVTVVAESIIDLDRVHIPPTAAVIAADGDVSVMVFEPAADGPGGTGVARRRAVSVEADETGRRLRVLSGLDAGERIVVAGPSALEDGERVRLFEGFGE